MKAQRIGHVSADETFAERLRRAAQAARDDIEKRRESMADREPDGFPFSRMPKNGWPGKHNLRGPRAVRPPVHRTSSKTLAGAYPFLAETGDSMTGPYIGENMLSRATFGMDPWDAYSAELIRSHSAAFVGVKGSGKSMLAKSWSTRLIRVGRKVAVPHDPNGEWVRVAEYVGGHSIEVGPGLRAKLNPLDPGPRDKALTDEQWRYLVLQDQRATLRGIIAILRGGEKLHDHEHTAVDLILEETNRRHSMVILPHVYELLREPTEFIRSQVEADEYRQLVHTVRRVVEGDIAGMFDGPSTVDFDTSAPMMVVNTRAMKNAPHEVKAVARLTTSNWIRRATQGSNREPRVVIHEEAAVELLNDVASGASGLVEKVAGEKVARHDGVANWYLLHRIADLDALGDVGSAVNRQAVGLLADCDTRISYSQHPGELERSQEALGLNDVQTQLIRKLQKGEGLWQIGQDRIAKVKNICTPGEMQVFRTDALGGARS